jgi:predicted Zn finger-like uncharacterized protein
VPLPPDQGVRIRCPKCKQRIGVVASEHLGVQTVFCPECNHSWDRKRPSEK